MNLEETATKVHEEKGICDSREAEKDTAEVTYFNWIPSIQRINLDIGDIMGKGRGGGEGVSHVCRNRC